MKKETYREIKDRHSESLNAFDGIFFAFSNEQFEEGMKKVGAKDLKDLIKIPGGGFILKTRKDEFLQLHKDANAEIDALKKDDEMALQALSYELCNHEYCYTGDSQDALDALGWDREDVSDDVYNKAVNYAASQG